MDYRKLISKKAIAMSAEDSLMDAEDSAPDPEETDTEETDADIVEGGFNQLVLKRAAVMAIVEANRIVVDPVKEKEARINKFNATERSEEPNPHEPNSYDGGVLNVEEV